MISAHVVAVQVKPDGAFLLIATTGFRERPDDPLEAIVWSGRRLPVGSVVNVDDALVRRERKLGTFRLLELHGEPAVADVPPERLVPNVWKQLVRSVMHRPLTPSQETGAAWLAQCLMRGEGGILADEPGLGKTTQALAAVASIGAWPCLIVCPPQLATNWQRELAFLRDEMIVQHIDRASTQIEPAHVYTLSSALLRTKAAEVVQVVAPKSLIVDEAHELKRSVAPDRHRAIVGTKLAHAIGRVILLTGTPVMNRPTEVWRLLHCVAPSKWPEYEDFRDRFCVEQDSPVPRGMSRVVTTHGRIERLEELQALMDPHLLRRRRADVLQELPAKVRTVETVELQGTYRKAYDDAERDVIAWMKRAGIGGGALSSKEESKALLKLSMLRRIAALGKTQTAMSERFAAWPKGKPLLVFAWHRAVVRALTQAATDAGHRVASWGRGNHRKLRQQTLDSFMAGDTNVLVLSIRAGGVGLNLQRAADVWFAERSWVPADLEQAESRAHRMGQEQVVNITYFDAKHTVDEDIASALEAKTILAARLLEDEEPEQVRRISLSLVLDKMRAKAKEVPRS